MFKREESKKLCEEVLHEVAKRHKIEITELSVMHDHIHTVIGIPPTMSVSKALQLFKGHHLENYLKENRILDVDILKVIFGVQENFTEVLVILIKKQ